VSVVNVTQDGDKQGAVSGGSGSVSSGTTVDVGKDGNTGSGAGVVVPIGKDPDDSAPKPKDEPGGAPTPIVPGVEPARDRPSSGSSNSQDSGQQSPSEKRVHVRGIITKISEASAENKDKNILGVVLIEGPEESGTEFDKAFVTMTSKTHLVREGVQTFAVEFAKFDSFKMGQKVQVQFTGPVRESYPVQATASEIVILK
jgi:hypothetical protein